MKNRKSALRKAVMAAMLAGAITTTGGVKANELDGRLSRNSNLDIDLTIALLKHKSGQADSTDGGLADIESILKEASLEDLKILISGFSPQEGYFRKHSSLAGYDSRIKNMGGPKNFLSQMLVEELKDRITSEANLKEEVIQLKADIEREKLTSKELSTKLEEVTSDRDKALSESVELANKLSVAQQEVERLNQAVDSLGRLTNSAKRELTEKLAEIEQLTQDKAKADADLETANANITTLQEELVDVKANVDKLSEDKAAADQVLAESNARVSNLEQEVAAANNRVADLEAQLAAKTAELDVVKADKAELEAKVKELQSLLEQKDRSNADLQANIERLKQELADKFKDQAQPRSKTPQASNSAAKQKASKPTAKPAGQLPSTGEATANPFFTAAAVAIMTGAGLVTVMPKRQKN